MFDITALGELLINFIPAGNSTAGNMLFERNPGGSPANLLAAASKLGAKTAFIGKVGDDQFGRYLEKILREYRIDITGLKFSPTVGTTLAFVQPDEYGDRKFGFHRNPGADMMLEEADIEEDSVKKSRVLHFGSISMSDEPIRSATLKALDIAKKNGSIISFDPSLRPSLWKSLEVAKKMIFRGLDYTDILKITHEEMEFITSETDLERGTKFLEKLGVKLIIVALGAKGTFYRVRYKTGYLATYDVKVVDTAGAGDAFMGGVLFKFKDMDRSEIKYLLREELENILNFANAVGASSTTKRGAIVSVPRLEFD